MDENRARELLRAERAEAEGLLSASRSAGQADREGIDDAIAESLRDRLAAIERAEQRLASGTFGKSVRSGAPIPDARLEANPLAELTIEEASADR
jgi:DnaK suppressor protein